MFRMREHDPLGFPEMGFVPPGTTDAGHVFLLEPTELRSHLVSPLLSVEPLKGYVGIPRDQPPFPHRPRALWGGQLLSRTTWRFCKFTRLRH